MSGNAARDLTFSCDCKTLSGRIKEHGVKSGTHVVCYCHDCRAAQLYFKQPDPAPGPVEIFQMAPEDIEIETGAEHLAVMQLSPKGMLRWYAKCCNAPLATTPMTPKFPFAGFIVKRILNPDVLGPITTRGFVPGPDGKQSHEKLRYAVVGLLKRTLRSRLSGSWKKTPFFKFETGEPVAHPTVLTKEERTTYYD
ncbi:hypothetical protein SAMN05444358_1011196 [Ruegeria halocynthiae]|uniref:CENP-V/GFA domain-containing protein n=1 Tax=Ruegeria halocynthiae TaxID=985054 RepID=A0A1H2UQ48_9RHOB|nr:DUF6151 family protein [Ruegeria halocynthiae]SDW57684.1 hypothetical protein SAMN05444358_1011196 [Ruegeria halocynthiae]